MAKRQKNLVDWKIVLDDAADSEVSTPSRRSRRTAQTSQALSVKLERQSDSTSLQVGDCVLLSGTFKGQRGSSNSCVAIVADIQLGIKNFLDVQVLPFVKSSDVSLDDLPEDGMDNEVYVVPELSFISLADFVEKVQVVSAQQFHETVLDISSSTFVCRRGCDRFTERFSDVFDYKDWHTLLLKNFHQAVAFIAEKTLIIISPNKAKSSTQSLRQRLQVSESPLRKRYLESSDEEYDDDSDDVVKEEEDDDSDDEEEDEEVDDKEVLDEKTDKAKRALTKKEPKEPRKKRQAASSSPSPKKPKRDNAKVKNLRSMLNKNFKVKSGASAASLPSLSPSKPGKQHMGTSSDAFRELKEKLHASARISSLPCREEQADQVFDQLALAIGEENGCCIYVSGTPGVGKTATIRDVVRQLKEISDSGGLNSFQYFEMNCLKLLTPNSAYEKLWEYIHGTKVTPSNAALLLEDYFSQDIDDDKSRELINSRQPLVVLLDELDQIVTKNQSVMYNFFNWPTYRHSKLIIIAVANTMDLPERMLSNKISSRLGLHRIQFSGYTFKELGLIIENRLTYLTEQNRRKVTLGADAVGFASRKVASVSGDARRALAICRRAVEIAELEFLESANVDGVPEEEQTFSILISHISRAINETVNSPLAQLLSSLSFASKLILVAVLLRIRRSGLAENSLGDIIDEMKNSLALLTTKESSVTLQDISASASMMDLLYSTGVVGDSPKQINIRMFAMSQLVNELVEHGILVQQNIRSERYRLVSLNISEDEVFNVLRKDREIASMF